MTDNLEALKRAKLIMQNENVLKGIREIEIFELFEDDYLKEYADQIATGDNECLKNYLEEVAPELLPLLVL
jgi:hypothetical protein